jgi:hypothetical protein
MREIAGNQASALPSSENRGGRSSSRSIRNMFLDYSGFVFSYFRLFVVNLPFRDWFSPFVNFVSFCSVLDCHGRSSAGDLTGAFVSFGESHDPVDPALEQK